MPLRLLRLTSRRVGVSSATCRPEKAKLRGRLVNNAIDLSLDLAMTSDEHMASAVFLDKLAMVRTGRAVGDG